METNGIAYVYLSLEKAGAALGISPSDLIHAGAFNQVQICVNIYARATGFRKVRIEENPEGGDDLSDVEWAAAEAEAEATGQVERWGCWLTRLKNNIMPAGVFEIDTEDLRLFEMPEIADLELVDGFKSDESGLWEVEFTNPVKISRADLVILTSEIARLQNIGGINAKAIVNPPSNRERTTYLNIIGALVELIQTPKSGRNSDAAVISELVANYSDKPGIKERTLQEKFAAAKRSLLSN